MHEVPSIIILKEAVQPFKGKRILSVSGNSKFDIRRLQNNTIKDFKGWGKHFLICFSDFSMRIHFLMFGSDQINGKKDREPGLSLQFRKGEINFCSCAIKFFDGNLNEIYYWRKDVMSDQWDAKKAK